jgi:hydroxymethylpyrimidine pyrophosphatase-like HAD family hydrolase
MKLCVVALDYDGTIAREGRVEPLVLEAVKEAQARGVVVNLVTGRIMADLRRVLPEHELFDAVVSENGAVLSFPNVPSRLLTHPPSQALLDELCARDIVVGFGDCIIEADAGAAPKILEAIRKLELPLVLQFNHGRVMVLRQGINKATGLREALNTLRLSLHNCVGIGDAENDYAMLDACEIGVAVSWGSKALQEIADEVLEGEGPRDVAAYIQKVTSHIKLPPHRAHSRRIILGHDAAGKAVEAAIHGRNILIAGDPRSGKSWITGLFCEQLILQAYCLCVIDPEGDYATLGSLPGVVLFGGDDPPPRFSDVARALRHPDVSIVIDLSSISHAEKLSYVNELLPMLASLRRTVGLPHWIVVDEAHYFLHQPNERCIDFELAAYVMTTYQPSQLHPELRNAIESIIVTPMTNPVEVHALAGLCGANGEENEWGETLGELGIDEAAVLSRFNGSGNLPRRFTISGRRTSHVRHRAKYLEVPLPAEHAFVFTCNGQQFGPRAHTLREFVALQERLPAAALEGHARRGDFSRWVRNVFGDEPLAVEIRQVEKDFRQGRIANLAESLATPIHQRYEMKSASESEKRERHE